MTPTDAAALAWLGSSQRRLLAALLRAMSDRATEDDRDALAGPRGRRAALNMGVPMRGADLCNGPGQRSPLARMRSDKATRRRAPDRSDGHSVAGCTIPGAARGDSRSAANPVGQGAGTRAQRTSDCHRRVARADVIRAGTGAAAVERSGGAPAPSSCRVSHAESIRQRMPAHSVPKGEPSACSGAASIASIHRNTAISLVTWNRLARSSANFPSAYRRCRITSRCGTGSSRVSRRRLWSSKRPRKAGRSSRLARRSNRAATSWSCRDRPPEGVTAVGTCSFGMGQRSSNQRTISSAI